MTTSAKATPASELECLYDRAYSLSGLPYRCPSHRMAEQLAATGAAAAYAHALALVTGDAKWQSRAATLDRDLRGRVQISQSDIDQSEHTESRARRYGLQHLL
jgi:hypothetical protein